MKDSAAQAYLQILSEQTELEESKLKHAAIALGAAGAIAAGALYSHIKSSEKPSPELIQAVQKPAKQDPEYLKNVVLQKFKIAPEKADQVVSAALKYAHPLFPQAHHLLALAGIESAFNEQATSKLKRDPARGALQIRPMVWNIHPKELSTFEGSFKHGAHILKTYHEKLGDADAAVQAYNIGIANLNKGKKRDAAARYLDKFKSELSRYSED